jgi:1L-myo-inositol 1-phosphate cytidylyltransferase / CDP-L-myo-inositol myo-inositolphosphotransferase
MNSAASLPLALVFADGHAANRLVAGVPAAARAVAVAALSEGQSPVLVAVPGGWTPSPLCLAEARRLSPDAAWRAADADTIAAARWIGGASMQCAVAAPVFASSLSDIIPADRRALQAEARQIIRATGKPGDGIVSRTINRPISQAISRVALAIPGARPGHATLVAALLGVAMLAMLLWGGETGLLAGAVLFQLASIVDGVDGEMARATFRASDRGAMLDSLTDAATNLSFIAGVSYNVWAGGDGLAASAGVAGFAILAAGSALLARQSRRDGGAFSFDALKHRMRERPSRARQLLIWMTMRDFYAFAAFVAILAGGASLLLIAFAIVAAGWFATLCWMLVRHSLSPPTPG